MGTIGERHPGIPSRAAWPDWAPAWPTVGIVSLFTRNADVDIPAGTQLEMVLQRPLLLEEENLAGVAQPGAAPVLVPAANQPKPIERHRPRILCPAGGLGCE